METVSVTKSKSEDGVRLEKVVFIVVKFAFRKMVAY